MPSLNLLRSELLRSNAETLLVAHQLWPFSEDELVKFTGGKIELGEFLCASKMMEIIKFSADAVLKIHSSHEDYWRRCVANLKSEITKAQKAGNRSKELDPILKKIDDTKDDKNQQQNLFDLLDGLRKIRTKIRNSNFGSPNLFGNGSRTATAIDKIIVQFAEIKPSEYFDAALTTAENVLNDALCRGNNQRI